MIKRSSLRLSSGLRVQAKFGSAKSLARLEQKIGKNGKAFTVLDYARLTVVFADPLLLSVFYEELRSKLTSAIVRVNNKFVQAQNDMTQPPNIHINFEFEDHICEVQLTLEDFALIKDYSHKPYEILRIARDDSGAMKTDETQLREAMEHIIAEGVYCPHPGTASYPNMTLHPVWM